MGIKFQKRCFHDLQDLLTIGGSLNSGYPVRRAPPRPPPPGGGRGPRRPRPPGRAGRSHAGSSPHGSAAAASGGARGDPAGLRRPRPRPRRRCARPRLGSPWASGRLGVWEKDLPGQTTPFPFFLAGGAGDGFQRKQVIQENHPDPGKQQTILLRLSLEMIPGIL